MKSQLDYQKERQELAEKLTQFNAKACIHFAEILRLNDTYKRLCYEHGDKPEELIPQRYFEAVYKILCFAPEAMRLTVMAGSADEIESLISRVETERGFYTEKGFWIEL